MPGTIPDIGVKGTGTKQQDDLVKTTKEALCQGYWSLYAEGTEGWPTEAKKAAKFMLLGGKMVL